MFLRCFIAIDIPKEIKEDIGEVINLLSKHDADIKWVKSENLHITLKFLGKTPDNLIPKIKEKISYVISSYKPFNIKIYGTGVFPTIKRPRVIWIGAQNSDVLINLKKDIEKSMSLLGYKKEDKEFNPHLTIGRIRSQRGVQNVITELNDFKDKFFGNIVVESIKLMKSDLKPEGAEYTCLSDFIIVNK